MFRVIKTAFEHPTPCTHASLRSLGNTTVRTRRSIDRAYLERTGFATISCSTYKSLQSWWCRLVYGVRLQVYFGALLNEDLWLPKTSWNTRRVPPRHPCSSTGGIWIRLAGRYGLTRYTEEIKYAYWYLWMVLERLYEYFAGSRTKEKEFFIYFDDSIPSKNIFSVWTKWKSLGTKYGSYGWCANTFFAQFIYYRKIMKQKHPFRSNSYLSQKAKWNLGALGERRVLSCQIFDQAMYFRKVKV